MSGSQIAALICAILLLLLGGCFLVFGIDVATHDHYNWGAALLLLPIAAAILALAGRLFWLAFRRRPDQGGSPDAPPPDSPAPG